MRAKARGQLSEWAMPCATSREVSSVRSRPEQKCSPSPASTTALIASGSAAKSASMPATVGSSMALRFSGRARNRTAISPRRSALSDRGSSTSNPPVGLLTAILVALTCFRVRGMHNHAAHSVCSLPPLAGEGWGGGDLKCSVMLHAPTLSLPRKRGRGRCGACLPQSTHRWLAETALSPLPRSVTFLRKGVKRSPHFIDVEMDGKLLARAGAERENAVEPGQRWIGGLEAHHGAEIIARRRDRLAARERGDDLGRTVAQAVAAHEDPRAAVGLDAVARHKIGDAV